AQEPESPAVVPPALADFGARHAAGGRWRSALAAGVLAGNRAHGSTAEARWAVVVARTIARAEGAESPFARAQAEKARFRSAIARASRAGAVIADFRLRIAFRAVGARAERGARAETAAIEMGGAGDRTARLDALGADDALRVTRAGLEGAISFLARAIDAREAARRVALVIAFAGLELARPPAGRIREHDTPLLARAVRKLVNGAVLPEWAIVLIRARVAALVLDAALSVRALCVGARA